MTSFDGWEEAGKELDDFADGLIRVPNRLTLATEVATADTAKAITKEAKRRVPVDSRELQRDIDWHKVADNHYLVGTDKEYAPPVEFGSRPHIITADSADVLTFTVNGQTVYTESVSHPGTEAQPFLRPALEGQRDNFRRRLKERTKNVFDSIF